MLVEASAPDAVVAPSTPVATPARSTTAVPDVSVQQTMPTAEIVPLQPAPETPKDDDDAKSHPTAPIAPSPATTVLEPQTPQSDLAKEAESGTPGSTPNGVSRKVLGLQMFQLNRWPHKVIGYMRGS